MSLYAQRSFVGTFMYQKCVALVFRMPTSSTNDIPFFNNADWRFTTQVSLDLVGRLQDKKSGELFEFVMASCCVFQLKRAKIMDVDTLKEL